MGREDRKILKQILNSGFNSSRQINIINYRLKRLQEDFNNPLSGSGTDRSGIRSGNMLNACEQLVVKKVELEELYTKTKEELYNNTLRTAKILELLEPNSTERIVLECRHLDFKRWKDIEKIINMCRSGCFKIYGKGLDKLLEENKVKEIIRNWGLK